MFGSWATWIDKERDLRYELTQSLAIRLDSQPIMVGYARSGISLNTRLACSTVFSHR